jgi:hypothetical protein
MNDLMCLPKCPVHGTQTIFREGRTPEQKWCGVWYDCPEPGCHFSELLPSKEIIALYVKMGKL